MTFLADQRIPTHGGVGQNWVYMVIKLQRGQVRQYVGVGANIY